MIFYDTSRDVDYQKSASTDLFSKKVFRRTESARNDEAQGGNSQIRKTRLAESCCLCGLQDGCWREEENQSLYGELDAPVPHGQITTPKGRSHWRSAEIHKRVLQSRHGGLAYGPQTRRHAATMGLRARALFPPLWKDVSNNGLGPRSKGESRLRKGSCLVGKGLLIL